jgi:hypothetical protein
MQSASVAHALNGKHFGQLPPQLMSVSSPFLAESVQVGAAQIPPLQTRLAQSVAVPHVEPTPQGAHASPPQSTPASLPFFTRSAHVGAAHVAPSQTWLAQSAAAEQGAPAPQPAQPPPQSVAVSAPFFVPSKHVGG